MIIGNKLVSAASFPNGILALPFTPSFDDVGAAPSPRPASPPGPFGVPAPVGGDDTDEEEGGM